MPYFTTGWPRLYSLPSSQTVLHISHNSDTTLTTLITAHGIYVWSYVQGEGVLLGATDRSAESLSSDGDNVFAVWHPDSSMIAVATKKNAILLYRLAIVDPAQPTAAPNAAAGAGGSLIGRTLTGIGHALFGSSTSNQPATGFELEAALSVPQFRSIRLLLTSKLRINPPDEAIVSFLPFGTHLAVATQSGIQVLSWDGRALPRLYLTPPVIQSPAPAPSQQSAALTVDTAITSPQPLIASPVPVAGSAATPAAAVPAPAPARVDPIVPVNVTVAHMTLSSALGLLAVVFSDGRVTVWPLRVLVTNPPVPTAAPAVPAAGAAAGDAKRDADAKAAQLLIAAFDRLRALAIPVCEPVRATSKGRRTTASGGGACAVAFNSKYRLLSVGMKNGDVVVYRVSQRIVMIAGGGGMTPPPSPSPNPATAVTAGVPTPVVSCTRHLTFSVSQWGFSPHDTGAVECFEWTPDGGALVVGWSRRGFVVWSVGGCRLFCTLPQLGSANVSAPRRGGASNGDEDETDDDSGDIKRAPATEDERSPPPEKNELLGTGVSALSWTAGGFNLLVCGRRVTDHYYYPVTAAAPTAAPTMWGESGTPSSSRRTSAITPALATGVKTGSQAFGTHSIPLHHTHEHKPPHPTGGAAPTSGDVIVPARTHNADHTCVFKFGFVHNGGGVGGRHAGQSESTSLSLMGEDRVWVWTGTRPYPTHHPFRRGVPQPQPPQRQTQKRNAAASARRPVKPPAVVDSKLAGKRAAPAAGADLDSGDDAPSDNENDTGSGGGDDNDDTDSEEEEYERRRAAGLEDGGGPDVDPDLIDSAEDWEQYPLPRPYLHSNWPPRHVALSASTEQIAVAGRNGVALYNRKTGKWRMFGNQNHERQIESCALSWYGEHVLVIANRIAVAPTTSTTGAPASGGSAVTHSAAVSALTKSAPLTATAPADFTNSAAAAAAAAAAAGGGVLSTADNTEQCEILFYPRTHLDHSSLIYSFTVHVPSRIISMDIADDILMLHLSNHQMLLYRLQSHVVNRDSTLTSGVFINPATYVIPAATAHVSPSTSTKSTEATIGPNGLVSTYPLLLAPPPASVVAGPSAAAASATPASAASAATLLTPRMMALTPHQRVIVYVELMYSMKLPPNLRSAQQSPHSIPHLNAAPPELNSEHVLPHAIVQSRLWIKYHSDTKQQRMQLQSQSLPQAHASASVRPKAIPENGLPSTSGSPPPPPPATPAKAPVAGDAKVPATPPPAGKANAAGTGSSSGDWSCRLTTHRTPKALPLPLSVAQRQRSQQISIVLLHSNGLLVVLDVAPRVLGRAAAAYAAAANEPTAAATPASPPKASGNGVAAAAAAVPLAAGFVNPNSVAATVAGMTVYVSCVALGVEQIWLHSIIGASHHHSGGSGSNSAPVWNPLQFDEPSTFTGRHTVRLFTYGQSGYQVWFRRSAQEWSPPPLTLGRSPSAYSFSIPLRSAAVSSLLPSSASAEHLSSPSLPVAAAAARVSSTSASPYTFVGDTLLEFDAEVYPLGIDSSIGVIVGVTKGSSPYSSSSSAASFMSQHRGSATGVSGAAGSVAATPSAAGGSGNSGHTSSSIASASASVSSWLVCFRLQSKLQPYLHGLLRHLVTNDDHHRLQYAVQMANACRSHQYFPIALELLLHSVINAGVITNSGGVLSRQTTEPAHSEDKLLAVDWSELNSGGRVTDDALGRVITFLKHFPEFLEIVISCARKNDSSRWLRLFTLTGSPLYLFNRCLRSSGGPTGRGSDTNLAGQAAAANSAAPTPTAASAPVTHHHYYHRYQTASCLLLVIQRTHGLDTAREQALRLLSLLQHAAQQQPQPSRRIAASRRRQNAYATLSAEIQRFLTLTEHELAHREVERMRREQAKLQQQLQSHPMKQVQLQQQQQLLQAQHAHHQHLNGVSGSAPQSHPQPTPNPAAASQTGSIQYPNSHSEAQQQSAQFVVRPTKPPIVVLPQPIPLPALQQPLLAARSLHAASPAAGLPITQPILTYAASPVNAAAAPRTAQAPSTASATAGKPAVEPVHPPQSGRSTAAPTPTPVSAPITPAAAASVTPAAATPASANARTATSASSAVPAAVVPSIPVYTPYIPPTPIRTTSNAPYRIFTPLNPDLDIEKQREIERAQLVALQNEVARLRHEQQQQTREYERWQIEQQRLSQAANAGLPAIDDGTNPPAGSTTTLTADGVKITTDPTGTITSISSVDMTPPQPAAPATATASTSNPAVAKTNGHHATAKEAVAAVGTASATSKPAAKPAGGWSVWKLMGY